MKGQRVVTATGTLVRLGFENPDASIAALRRLGNAGDRLVEAVAATADPDQAVGYLSDLADTVVDRDELLGSLVADERFAGRLLAVLGASAALGDHLLRHPEQWREVTDPALDSTRPTAFSLRSDLLRAVGADPTSSSPVSSMPDEDAVDALRVHYRRLLLRLASRDLAAGLGMDDVAAELSDLAAGTLDAALAVARARVGATASSCRLAVIAMGKCGGRELNYVSDVDVIFVAEPADGAEETASLGPRHSWPRT